ncbi:DMT family transporter [Citricoccus sp.]|uniref:EamA family transporter n=1 Tax=Citricoccus sp. TaxID=1978372 RepID=UPI00262988C0|nr:EamA family transporter [Citricoccus sp.]HRO29915.1 EamA family transporter [Citricoccus sp.]HRO94733.1 EamA family transporter [Citricoccus sp.]
MTPSTNPLPIIVPTPRAVGVQPRALATGVVLVIGACVSLQFGAAVAVQLFPVLGPWGVTTLRLGLAAVVLLGLVRPRIRSWTRAQWTAVVLFGISMGAMNGVFYAAIDRIPLGVAVSIEFLGPLVLAALLARRWVDGLWVAVALAGMALLAVDSASGDEALDPVGVLFALVAGAFWMAYILTSKRVGALMPGSGGLAVALVVATAVVAPLGVPGAAGAFADPALLGLGLLVALLSSVVPYSLELNALRRLPPAVFSILLSLEPAFAALFGWLLLGQESGLLRTLAIVLVVAASAGVTLTARRLTPAGSRRGR